MCRVEMADTLVATPSYGSLLHFDLEVRFVVLRPRFHSEASKRH
jgi:hypothetical protein